MKKWKKFERVVAAIHAAEMKGATVTWNENIDGRQFDVVIRAQLGFYDFLTLIECKDVSRPLSVEKVEAFVTKSRRVRADKAILVSSCGFQRSAKKVAKENNIELYSLKEISSVRQDILDDVFGLILYMMPVRFIRSDTHDTFPFYSDSYNLYDALDQIRLNTVDGGSLLSDQIDRVLKLVSPYSPPRDVIENQIAVATLKPQRMLVTFPRDTIATIQPLNITIPVAGFDCYYWMGQFKGFKEEGFDFLRLLHRSLKNQFEFKNELTQDSRLIQANDVQLGFDTKLEVGKFYNQPPFDDFFYLIEAIENNVATIFLVESFQHGELVQMRYTQDLKFQRNYVEISDEQTIARLKKLYEARGEVVELEMYENMPFEIVIDPKTKKRVAQLIDGTEFIEDLFERFTAKVSKETRLRRKNDADTE